MRSAFAYHYFYLIGVSFFALSGTAFQLYCNWLGFSASQIAFVVLATNVSFLLGAPAGLFLASKFKPAAAVIFTTIAALLAIAGLIPLRGFLPVLLVWCLWGFFKQGGDSIVDASAIRRTVDGRASFERARLWGSVGYILALFMFGYAIDTFGYEVVMPLTAALMLMRLLAAWNISPVVELRSAGKRDSSVLRIAAAKRSVILLLLSAFLLSGSHAPLFVYLPLYLHERGWTTTDISGAMNIGVVFEIVIFALFPYLERKMPLRVIYAGSIVLAIVRWLILASGGPAFTIYVAQSLHAFSFASWYSASVRLIFWLLPEEARDRGQAILYAWGIAGGGLIGRVFCLAAAPYLTSSYSSTPFLFIFSAAASLAALAISLFIQEPQKDAHRPAAPAFEGAAIE